MRNPDKTMARIGEDIISNSQFFQLVAPIMNELEALSVHHIALPLRTDISVLAAVFAAFLSKISVTPIPKNLSKTESEKILKELNIPTFLTPERMHYYYRMTFEDALSKIDNGLYDIPDDFPLWIDCKLVKPDETSTYIVKAGDFQFKKTLSLSEFFSNFLTPYPELCSIF